MTSRSGLRQGAAQREWGGSPRPNGLLCLNESCDYRGGDGSAHPGFRRDVGGACHRVIGKIADDVNVKGSPMFWVAVEESEVSVVETLACQCHGGDAIDAGKGFDGLARRAGEIRGIVDLGRFVDCADAHPCIWITCADSCSVEPGHRAADQAQSVARAFSDGLEILR